MNSLILKYRRILVVWLHLTLIMGASYAAFSLRFDGSIPPQYLELWWQTLPWLVAIQAATLVPFRLYEGIWRYTGIWDLRNIVAGVTIGSGVFYLLVQWRPAGLFYPRSIVIIDSLLLILAMGGVRLGRRIYRELWHVGREKRVLIFGASDAGEMIVRDMKQTDQYEYEPIGFVDDNRDKIGQRIHGVPVLGTREDLPRIIAERRPHEILIAMPHADAATIRGILKALEPHKIKITTLPNLRDILDGTVTVSQIRNLSVEDLLTRAAIGLDSTPVRRFIKGRRVMVTGAGGSIGSELCRQIAALKPAALLLYERYENNLFAIVNDLADRAGGPRATPIVGDVGDIARLDAVLQEHRPEIIFHAAAHKHVPLMEQNPCEAVKNNVMATRLLADAAERHGVDRFILISTDKAVNPTSVMGATKRVAELLVQSQGVGSGTSFFTVRFGNVLASNGSVVPRFLQQIRAGGPVTVTHPEMRRYFMLIPEAAHLVLHTAAQGASGEIYVLEMGEQVKVVDMARNLIRLSGLVPDEDIPITFVGLRPGEKLFEELVSRDETVTPSGIDKILRVRQRDVPAPDRLAREVASLERLALEGRATEALAQLRAIVPEFQPEAAAPAVDRARAGPAAADERVRARSDEFAGQTCLACHSADVHRSRTHSFAERARRTIFRKRPFRCRACGWRGWQLPLEPLTDSFGQTTSDTLNPTMLDASLQSLASPARAAFSPRQLG